MTIQMTLAVMVLMIQNMVMTLIILEAIKDIKEAI